MTLIHSKTILFGIVPFFLLLALTLYLLGPASLDSFYGTILPDISIEKVEFTKNEIHLTIRNTGPIPVSIAMADVNDRIQSAAIEPDAFLERFETAIVRIPFDWNESEPYVFGITTDDGTRFEKSVDAAVARIEFDIDSIQFFALVGTYVGIIPIFIGLMWLPFIKTMSKTKYLFFLSLTVGFLIFLGLDTLEESLSLSTQSLSPNFNGILLAITVAITSFILLYYSAEKMTNNTRLSNFSKPLIIALMVSIGIGLHNLGEGLAIGAAIGLGELGLTTFLILGFALHNTTEGIAIASPISKTKISVFSIIGLGLIAGVPAILGTWIGGFFFSPFSAIIFLAIGSGAIFQVVMIIVKWIKIEGNLVQAPFVTGTVLGLLIMYVLSIFV